MYPTHTCIVYVQCKYCNQIMVHKLWGSVMPINYRQQRETFPSIQCVFTMIVLLKGALWYYKWNWPLTLVPTETGIRRTCAATVEKLLMTQQLHRSKELTLTCCWSEKQLSQDKSKSSHYQFEPELCPSQTLCHCLHHTAHFLLYMYCHTATKKAVLVNV